MQQLGSQFWRYYWYYLDYYYWDFLLGQLAGLRTGPLPALLWLSTS